MNDDARNSWTPEHWPDCKSVVGPWQNPPDGLPMFGAVVDGCIYRSGQPTAEGFRRLADWGFRTVVSLRAESADDPPTGLPLALERIPIEDEHAPTAAAAQKWLEIAGKRALFPLLVHCNAGRGRASVASALVRYSLCGWPLNDRAAPDGYIGPTVTGEVRLYRRFPLGVHVPLARAQREFLRAWAAAHVAGALRPIW